MSIEPLQRLADRAPGRVRILPRFIPDPEIPALMRKASVLALPYRDIEQSGVLNTGLAFAKPMVLGDVGGFAEFAREHGAARLVPPGDPDALAAALNELIADPAQRQELSEAARAAAGGAYGWDAIAARTLALYERLGARPGAGGG
jgi:glycosyltransferase involved in cell wall biosynthesis